MASVFLSLFGILALLHAAEIAITTLYPWKVREFAKEEGDDSPFHTLNNDITKVLTTILITSTTTSIYATTLFASLVSRTYGAKGERYGSIILTALTLFFVELVPKSIGINNAEFVARRMVAPINLMGKVVGPFGLALTYMAKSLLKLFGMQTKDLELVSEEELRLIVTGARESGSIETSEGDMIQGVLDLQDQKIKEIMRPRVEMIAVPQEMSVVNVLGVIKESGFSRIPVYDGDIDNIVGIVLAKDLIDIFVSGLENNSNDFNPNPNPYPNLPPLSPKINTPLPQNQFLPPTGEELAARMAQSIDEASLIDQTYFVPQTMIAWNVLQEMRRRRVHLAIVVDEFGGTEGLVSLEDIIEEVVGEIYDEDDDETVEIDEDAILLGADGSYTVRGDADLEDVGVALGIKIDDNVMKEIGTISGFLIYVCGEIPKSGDVVLWDQFSFTAEETDEKKILEVKVERLVGTVEPIGDGENSKITNKEEMTDDSTEDADYPSAQSNVSEEMEEDLKNEEESKNGQHKTFKDVNNED
ncbi:hypothetical protein ScalyP_jg11337 [Parmales sp. scaly parma]|nr:hypothetical protein ScalyP_jg11337 [Parmales sp. scaly parma]